LTRYSEIFFESYSMAIEAAYDAYMKIVGGEFPKEDTDTQNEIGAYLDSEYKKWLNTAVDKLAGKTPVEYMDLVDGLDNIMMMFNYGAVICDDDLPEIYLQKLQSYGEDAVDALIRLAAHSDIRENDNSLLSPVMAVKVLGKWKARKSVIPLIKLLDTEGEMFDLMFETVKEALVNIGAPALDSIADALESGKYTQAAGEYLLMAFTEIGKNNRSDKIYTQIKKAFLEMPEKLIAASCLGDYGDGRAIPVLRGYIDKNGPSLNRETFYEILSAIKKLGGNSQDLKFQN
jgi:hypothetical protein